MRSAKYISPSRGGLNGGSKISVYKVIISLNTPSALIRGGDTGIRMTYNAQPRCY